MTTSPPRGAHVARRASANPTPTGGYPTVAAVPGTVPAPGSPDERVAAYRATARARAVVSRYGDQDCAWSVLLGVRLTAEIDPDLVQERLTRLCRRHPHLGAAPTVQRAPSADMLRAVFAARPYAPREPLVRVAVGTLRPDLLIAAHHGAVDGLGMVALLGAALGRPVRTEATGPEEHPARQSLAAATLRRVGEALCSPPTRLHRSPTALDGLPGAPRGREEILMERILPRHRIGTTTAVAAATAVATAWNREHGIGYGRIVAGVGAARREAEDPLPLRPAPFVRLPVPAGADQRMVRMLLRAHPPEPDFPAGGTLSRLAVRLLAERLAATFLVSNLGVIEVEGMVRSASFYPAVNGPAGIAFGGVSTARATTLTVRTRRRDFSPDAATTLLDSLVAVLPAPAHPPRRVPDAG